MGTVTTLAVVAGLTVALSGSANSATAGQPGPHRVTCTSAGGITTGDKTSAPGNGYAVWTALPAPLPACQEQAWVKVFAANGLSASSGMLKSTSANLGRVTEAKVPQGLPLARARLEVQFTNNPGSRLCKVFDPPGDGQYHPCTNVKSAAKATLVSKRVNVTWFHICMALNHNLCWTSNGVGRDLSVVSSGYNKWQAIPDGSGGEIMWQNGSNNCADVFNGAVQNVGSACIGSASEDWTVGGSGNVTFNNTGTELFAGTNGASNGKLIYAHPAMTGFDRGWVTFSCCKKG
jgi:hypothetical protein